MEDPDAFTATIRHLRNNPEEESRDTIACTDGRVFERYYRPRFSGGRLSGRVWSFHDVTQRTVAERKLETLATTDALTGAYNRSKFNELISMEIERARRFGHPLSLILFDIDFFKIVNDSYGHETGDEVLKKIAERVRSCTRTTNYFVR